MDINPEELRAQLPELQDLSLVYSRMQTYVREAKAQPNHFGQTPNASAAGNFTRQSLDALATSLNGAQQYMSQIITAVQGTVGLTNQNETQTKQTFDNRAV
ncbi:MAG: hypothetical protein ABW215_00595 [Kibdelosporangium sp.]